MKIVVAVLAFNRPHLLAKVLEGLRRQTVAPHRIALIQDGGVDPYTGEIYTAARTIERNTARFRSVFPGQPVKLTANGENIGVALNYWRAETWAFEEERADTCIFLEDDVFPSRKYFKTMKRFAALAAECPRIGAFSAYGDAGLDVRQQAAQRRKPTLMHHRWGHGMTRAFWSRSADLYRQYLKLTEGRNYRHRDAPRILAWFQSLGLRVDFSSQDAAHTAVMLKLGCVALSTTPAFAVNFGKLGLHYRPEPFHRYRIKPRRVRFYPWALRDFGFLGKFDFDACIAEQRAFAYW